MFTHVAIVCFLGVAAAAPSLPLVDSISIPRYGFNYAVSDPLTGDNKAQTEHRDGGVVKGSYSLSEPDGTIRVVNYAADPVSGFNAEVKRIGPAAHPQQYLAPVAKIAQVAPVIPAIATSAWGLGLGANHHGLGSGLGLGSWGWSGGLGGHGLDGHGLGGHGLDGHGLGGHGLGGYGFGGHGLGDYGLDGYGHAGHGWEH